MSSRRIPALNGRVRVQCAYRLVSVGCISLKLATAKSTRFAGLSRLAAVNRNLLSRTHNPLVPGSNPGGPIETPRRMRAPPS